MFGATRTPHETVASGVRSRANDTRRGRGRQRCAVGCQGLVLSSIAAPARRPPRTVHRNTYAEKTPGRVERSRAALEGGLQPYGAAETLINERPGALRLESVFQGLRIAFPFALPLPGAFPTDAGRQRESRRPWRVVVLTLKGKAEVAAEEPETVDRAFLAHLPLPDGVTMVGAGAIPTPWGAYRTGRMPKGLLSGLVPPTVAALGGGRS